MADMEMNKKQEKLSKFIETVIKDALYKQMEMIEKRFLEFSEKMDIENKKLGEKITVALEKFSKRMEQMEEKFGQVGKIKMDLEEKMKGIQIKEKEVEQKASQVELNLELMELRLKKNAIRLRGCPEEEERNLREIMSEALAIWTELDFKDIFSQIENVYRVNSQPAMQKNLPRDVVIYFTNFEMKRKILKAVYEKDLWMKGETVWIFKEIPRKMLLRRKQFSFLTIELRKRRIVYRWETPNGLSFKYREKRYYLNTLEKAQDFYDNILGEKTAEKPIKEMEMKGGEDNMNKGRDKNLIPQVKEKRDMLEEKREQIKIEIAGRGEGKNSIQEISGKSKSIEEGLKDAFYEQREMIDKKFLELLEKMDIEKIKGKKSKWEGATHRGLLSVQQERAAGGKKELISRVG